MTRDNETAADAGTGTEVEAPSGFLEPLQMTKEERQERHRERARERQQEQRDEIGTAHTLGQISQQADGEEPKDPLTEAAHRELSQTITVFDEDGPGVDLDILPVDPDRGVELGRKATEMQNAIAKLDDKSEDELSDEDIERVKELKSEVARTFDEVTLDPRYDSDYVYDTQSGLHIAIAVMNAIQEDAAEAKEKEAEEAAGFR